MEYYYRMLSSSAPTRHQRHHHRSGYSQYQLVLSLSTGKDNNDGDDSSSTTKEFIRWLYEEQDCQGDVDDIEIIKTTTTPNGQQVRGLYASKDIDEGEYIFAIPFTSAITIEENESSDVERGYKLLQIMKEKQDDSSWKPYWDMLPQRDCSYFDPTPDFWPVDEIQKLELPQMIDEVMEKKQSIKELSMKNNIDLDELQFATWLVNSRAITLIDNGSEKDDEAMTMSER